MLQSVRAACSCVSVWESYSRSSFGVREPPNDSTSDHRHQIGNKGQQRAVSPRHLCPFCALSGSGRKQRLQIADAATLQKA